MRMSVSIRETKESDVLKQAFALIKGLKSTSKRLAKQALLEKGRDNEMFRYLVEAATGDARYHSSPRWAVVDKRRKKAELPNGLSVLRYTRFRSLLETLSDRDLTGHAARDAAESLFVSLSDAEFDVYSAVITRRLDIGVARTSIEAVYGVDNKAPLWKRIKTVMLASSVPPNLEDLPFPLYAEPKFDGIRISYFPHRGAYVGVTRNGKQYPALAPFEKELARVSGNVMVDTEILAANWNQTGVLRKKNPSKEDINSLRAYCFDAVPVKELEGSPSSSQRKRKKLLKGLLKGLSRRFVYVPAKRVNSVEELTELYNQWLEEGWEDPTGKKIPVEGMMLKVPTAPYSCDRSKSWMKHKPMQDLTVRIIGFKEGNGKWAGILGAFAVELPNGKGNRLAGIVDHRGKAIEAFGVTASGRMSEAMRRTIWANRKQYVGRLIDVRVQADATSEGTIRFPIVLTQGEQLRIRDDLDWGAVQRAAKKK